MLGYLPVNLRRGASKTCPFLHATLEVLESLLPGAPGGASRCLCVAGVGTASGLELVSAPVHTRLLAQGAGKEIKGSCGHWVSVWCNVTRNSMFGRELEVFPRLLHLVHLRSVCKGYFEKGWHPPLGLLSVRVSEQLPSHSSTLKSGTSSSASHSVPGAGRGHRRCHVGRGRAPPAAAGRVGP